MRDIDSEAIREWANGLRDDAKAAGLFASLADDEPVVRAWLSGFAEGLRLAAMRTYQLTINDDGSVTVQGMPRGSRRWER